MVFGPVAWYGQLHEFAKCCNGIWPIIKCDQLPDNYIT